MRSGYYATDPTDPDAPVVLAVHCGMSPGALVRYTATPALPGPLTVSELLDWGDHVMAILNDGEYEVDAANLEPEATR